MTDLDADGRDREPQENRLIIRPSIEWTSRIKYALASVFALALLAIGALIAFSAGPVPGSLRWLLGRAIPPLPISTTQALLVAALAGIGMLYLRYDATKGRDTDCLVDRDSPPETAQNAPRVAGDAFESDIADALDEIRLKAVAHDDTDPHRTLCDLVSTVVQLRDNCSPTEAERVIEEGTWTTDPVARAFCSDSLRYPVRFRLLRWARPEIAYETALDRTCDALSRVAARELGGASATRPPKETERSTSRLESLGRSLREAIGVSRRADERPPEENGTAATDQNRGLASESTRGDD
jgi:hypothetical protein